MRLKKYLEQEPQAASAKRAVPKSAFAKVAGHGSFVPMLTAWGAALLGLIVIVLPGSAIERFAALTGLDAMGGMAKYAFAGFAALVGAGLTLVIASAIHERARRSSEQASVMSAVSSRRVRPIDPVAELGSDSLDAPIDKIPFAPQQDDEFEEPYDGESEQDDSAAADQEALDELSQRGFNIEDPDKGFTAHDVAEEEPDFSGDQTDVAQNEALETLETLEVSDDTSADTDPANAAVAALLAGPALGRNGFAPRVDHEAQDESQAAPEIRSPTLAERPRALDLGEFAAMPGRNGVWVHEEADAPLAAPAAPPELAAPAALAATVAPATSALEKLRRTPTQNLSMVQMVERFAGALHERQNAQRGRLPNSEIARDAALAEALKALTLFTQGGFNQANPAPASAPARAPVSEPSSAPVSHADNTNEAGQTERQLREALVQLQSLRGAA